MEFTEDIYKKYKNMVYKLAWGFTDSITEFNDLIQQGFIGLGKACREFDNRTKFSTFAYQKIYGEIRFYLDYKRDMVHIPNGKKKETEVFYTEDISYVEQHETDYNLLNDLDIALLLIRDDISPLIRMRFYDGMSKRAIAHKTGLSYDTVRYRIEKGLKDMRKYL